MVFLNFAVFLQFGVEPTNEMVTDLLSILIGRVVSFKRTGTPTFKVDSRN
jgi:hypothetical protein